MIIQFTKIHGAGNDFVMVDNRNRSVQLIEDQIIWLCDRNFGIGADGLILIENRDDADCYMNYYNSDGSLVEMCGNGIRCSAEFYFQISGEDKLLLQISTPCGVKTVMKKNGEYQVNMGRAEFLSSDIPSESVDVEGLSFHCVSMGNPHAVTFVDDVNAIDLATVGSRVESFDAFPNKINVEFAEIINDHTIKVRVWERGSGVTLACGTGACGVYAVARNQRLISGGGVTIQLPGGNLFVEEDAGGNVLMTGPAKVVFNGEIEI